MKILYICADPGIPIRGHKGAAIHVRALVDAFAALGHPVTLVTPRPGPVDGPAPKAHLMPVPSRLAVAGSVSPQEREDLAREIAEAVHLAAQELLAREPFDLIYERYSLWSDVGARLACASGLPLVVEVNAPLRAEAARYRTLCHAEQAAEIEERLLSGASAVAVVSSPLRQYVIGRGANADRVHVLPNAVDEQLFHPGVDGDAVRAKLGLTEKLVIGFVGTVKPWHDLDTLLAAVAQLRAAPARVQGRDGKTVTDYHLLLVGEIPASVRAAIAQHALDDASTIIEPLPHAEVPPYIEGMDIAVSPHPAMGSTASRHAAEKEASAQETPVEFYFSPLKLFEYLACGVATVASDVPSFSEVISDGVTGLLYPPGDADALAERLDTLAMNAAARTHLGWQGATRVLKEHTWKRNAQEIIGWLFPERGAIPEEPLPVFDEKLRRRLFRATRADVAAPLLGAHLPAVAGHPFDRVTCLEVLKYKPRRRCVIAYELAASDGQITDGRRKLIGKVFRDERAARLCAQQQSLWADGFGVKAEDGITIAQPLAYVPEMRMLLQERAPGLTLDYFLGTPDFSDRVRRSAAAIAKLHDSDVRPPKEYTLDTEVSNLKHFAADLATWRPERAEAFARQLAALHTWAATLPPADLVPSHRDFYYSQVLFADQTSEQGNGAGQHRQRVTLIDLDMFALADPAIDVANFAAHLRFLALQCLPDIRALDEDAARFVDEYARHRPTSQVFFKRLAFYEAATLFRLMHVVLQRPLVIHCFDELFEINSRRLLSDRACCR